MSKKKNQEIILKDTKMVKQTTASSMITKWCAAQEKLTAHLGVCRGLPNPCVPSAHEIVALKSWENLWQASKMA